MKKQTHKPLVSVIMPVYNAGLFLAESIESILNQTYKNFEFIIVDDGSIDDSWNIIQKYAKKDRRIRALRFRKNHNEAGNGAMNKVLKHATGEYIARMDADDVAHRYRLSRQVRFMENNPEVILCGTQARVINAAGEVVGDKSYPTDHDSIYRHYATVHPIVHPSCMIRRSMLPDKNKLYELRFGVNDDYYTFFKLMRYGKFANLPDRLVDYRIHGSNASLQNLKNLYQNISAIRQTAVVRFGYEMTLVSKITIYLQTLVVFLIPEKILTGVYLFIRGIDKEVMYHYIVDSYALFLNRIRYRFSIG